MSFWKKAGELSLKAGKAVVNQSQEINALKEEISNMSDKELIKRYKSWSNGSYQQRFAGAELSRRGYSKSDI